jgi:hypothetical protein
MVPATPQTASSRSGMAQNPRKNISLYSGPRWGLVIFALLPWPPLGLYGNYQILIQIRKTQESVPSEA